jgi:hypothetical protein
VINNEVLYRAKEINILHTRKRMKTNWTVYILRRKCLLKHVTEGKIEGTREVRGIRRRSKHLLNDFKRRHWKLEEEARDLIYGTLASQ